MGDSFAFVGAACVMTLFFGSIAAFIQFIVSKISRQNLSRKIFIQIYVINLAIWMSCSALVSLFSKPSQAQVIYVLTGLTVVWVLFFFFGFDKTKKTEKKTVKGIKETKCTCQACGNIWYYGKGEFLENMGQQMINSANQSSNCSTDLLCCSGCLPALFIPKAQQVPVKDLKKCPKCNSSAIKKEEVIHELS